MHIPVLGMGAISAAGPTAARSYESVASGADMLKPLTLFSSELKQSPRCGQIDEFETGDAPNRTAAFAQRATQEALRHIERPSAMRLGLVTATTVGGITRSERFYRALKNDPAAIKTAAQELAAHEPTALSGWLASRIRAHGFHTISTACSTGLHAIGMAARLLAANRYDLCLAVGADALSILTVRGFASLMLIDYEGCKPFDKNRKGISLGEGAGALLLASEQASLSLGVQPLGFIDGWGASADAWHMTAPHPEGLGAASAMRAALGEAGCEPSQIDFVGAHGTATPDNDCAEIAGMRTLFDPLPPFGSMKRTLGHTLAASGALETVFLISALQSRETPATGGFFEPDERIDASPATRNTVNPKRVLKNSFGFGGNNAALVLSVA